MTPNECEAQLRSEGFTEIERQDLAARPVKGRHRHPFAIRGLVLGGAFIVMQGDAEMAYEAGQVFSAAAGELHDEAVGLDGANVVVGRRFEGGQTAA